MNLPYSPERPLLLGGRGSKMALAQANIAANAIIAAYPQLAAPGAIKYTVITTSGDRTQQKGDIPLAAFGSKELWTKEVEIALAEGRIDVGVHCVKDVHSFLPEGFTLSTVLKRDDPRDAWLCFNGFTLADLPAGSVVGTSSLRRQGIILSKRPDLVVQPLRGNADTRIEKLRAGQVRATLLSRSGLDRIHMADVVREDISVDDMLPACGQGALCFEVESSRPELVEFLTPVNHQESWQAIIAERAMLQTIDGNCHTPVGSYAMIEGDQIYLRGLVVRPDGTGMVQAERRGLATDAVRIGTDLGQELRKRGPQDIFDALENTPPHNPARAERG